MLKTRWETIAQYVMRSVLYENLVSFFSALILTRGNFFLFLVSFRLLARDGSTKMWSYHALIVFSWDAKAWQVRWRKHYFCSFYFVLFFYFPFLLFWNFKFKLEFFFLLLFRLFCPICSKSVFDMSKFWKKLDDEVLLLLKANCTNRSRNNNSIT